MHMKPAANAGLVAALVLLAGVRGRLLDTQTPQSTGGDADRCASFLGEANETLLRLSNEANQAGWVQQTYITPDTEAISSRADQAFVTAVTDYAKKAARFDGSGAPRRRTTPADCAEEHADHGGAVRSRRKPGS